MPQPKASKPTQPKGIGDLLRFPPPCPPCGWGIKAHPAERHWRLVVHRPPPSLSCLASKPTQPKGIGDLAAKVQRGAVLVGGIKAHPAERHWRQVSRRIRRIHPPLASKPTQPKGIGDEVGFHRQQVACFGHQSPPSRKALETRSSGVRSVAQVFGIKAHPAERHWRPGSFVEVRARVGDGIKAHPAERHWRHFGAGAR